MNSLEDKLRISRTTEVPGLQPPAGGWDAIHGQLKGPTPGPSAPPAGKGLLMKPWTILAAVILTLSLTYYLLPSSLSAPMLAENEVQAPAETSLAKVAEKVSSTTPAAVPTESSGTLVASNQRSAPKVENSTPATESVLTTAAPTATIPGSKAAGEPQLKPSVTSANNNAESGQRGATKPSTTAGASPIEALMPEYVTAEDITAKDVHAENGEGDFLPTKEEEKVSELVSNKEEIIVATERLRVSGIRPLPVEQASFPSVGITNVPDLPEYARNGKLKVRPELQLHGGLSGHYIPSFRNSRIYDRDVSTGGVSRLFVFPNGEPLPVRFRRSELRTNLRRNIRLDVGISRQTSSGFLFRAIGGFYYATDDRRQDNFEQLTGTQVREDYYLRELAVPVEVGVQYTFRKRHRFRPFVGVNAIGYLHYSGVERYSFFDAQTQSGGNISEFRSQGVNFGDFDFSLTTGFQYKFSQQWSAGINLYAHSMGSYFLESPFGIEVRYSLK